MKLVKVKCAFCDKEFFRERTRYNEAKKFGWNQYCSKGCQNKAKTTRVEKVCGNPNCSHRVSRTLNQFRKSKSKLIFCSRSCAAIVNNERCSKRKRQNRPRKRGKYIQFEVKICVKCGRQFKASKGKKYCSAQCRKLARQRYTPQQLMTMIRRKTQKLKRIPAKREMKEIAEVCVSAFGSWNSAIIAAGFKPNRSHSQRMYKRIITKALDGHSCDSVSELLIDNWFTQNNIPHQKDIPYPKTNHKADWEISVGNKEIFVEYFGLANDSPRYDRTIKEKIKLCQNCKIPLIEIYPKDIYPKNILDNNLKNKFREIFNV